MFAFIGGIGLMELIIIGGIVLLPVAIAVVVVVVALSRSRKALDTDSNLTPCPDCARLVSLRATTCPQCGCPLQTQQ